MPGNAVIAGHVTHRQGAGPFQNLESLNEGDLILASGDGVTYRYMVESIHLVSPNAIEYALPGSDPDEKLITLITCGGWDQATRTYTQRVIVRARAL
jgi:LPXTG-site transpeptidase (sortase) family protein